MSAQRGYPSQQKLERTPIQFVTVEPVHKEQNGASVVAHQFVYQVGTDAAEAGSTVGKIVATGHAALEGDVILMTSGSQSGKEIKVVSVSANEINLAEDLPSAIGAGDTFSILRHKYPTVSSDGAVNVNAVVNEVAVAADGGALPALTKVVSGYDGTNVQVLKTDAAGELQVDVLSSALPAGAATETTLSAIKTAVELIDDAISGSEMQVDVVSSALPAGAATETTLLAVEADTSTLAGAVLSNKVQTDVNSIDGVIDTNNQTQVLLNAGATYTGGWTEIVDYASITVGVYADVDSAVDGLKVEFSYDGTNVHHTHTYTYLASSNGIGYIFQPEFRYFRVRYTNGASIQGNFKLISVLRYVPTFPSLYRLSHTLTKESQVTLTKSVIVGETTAGGGAFVDVKVNPSGALTVEADVTSSVLPTGAATETTLSAIKTAVELIDNAVSGNEIQVDVVTSALPAGAATETTLGLINGKTPSLGQAAMSASSPVVIASNQTAIPVTASSVGKSVVARARNVYSSVNVTTGAYVQLVASLGATVNEVEIFDSSGETLVLATGGAGSEVDQAFVFPGGNGRIPLAIAAATRVSIKAVSATANSGEIAINFYS